MRYYIIPLVSLFISGALLTGAEASCRYDYYSGTVFNQDRVYYQSDMRDNYTFEKRLGTEPGTDCNILSTVDGTTNYHYYYDNANEYSRTYVRTINYEAAKGATYTRTLEPQAIVKTAAKPTEYTRTLVPQASGSYAPNNTTYVRTIDTGGYGYQREKTYTYSRTYN